jgi:hypothetical protein
LDSWQQLQQFLQQHGDRLNFLNVVALVTHAAALQQVCMCLRFWLPLPLGLSDSEAST